MTPQPVRVVGPRYRKPLVDDGSVVVNTTSHGGWLSDLSPFKLGPVALWGHYVSCTTENGWQYTKVYEEHVDSNGNPTAAWGAWALQGWHNRQAVRYPMSKGRKPLYSWWDGLKLAYVPARKRIYVPLYAKAVVATEGFRRLKEMYESGVKLVLWDFDGYEHL